MMTLGPALTLVLTFIAGSFHDVLAVLSGEVRRSVPNAEQQVSARNAPFGGKRRNAATSASRRVGVNALAW